MDRRVAAPRPAQSQLYSSPAHSRSARPVALSQEVNRLHKLLETANIKLASVASDILGKSGRRMLDCLLEGLSDPEALADLARGSLRGKIAQLREALDGRVDAHHRILLQQLLAHIDFLEQSMQTLLAAIESRLLPYEQAMQLLLSIPGIQRITAATIVGEIGVDMTRFPSAKHLASWAGVCPGNKQSGGKRLSSKARQGNTHLRAILGEVAWSITHTSGTYLSALYHRIARRRGKHKAILAVAHSVLVSIYYMLRDQQPYHDLGPDHFDHLDTARQQRHYVRRLEQLGY